MRSSPPAPRLFRPIGPIDRAAPLFVVGARTARAAEAEGWRLAAPPAPDAARLVETLKDAVPSGAAVLYLAGRDRKPAIEAALAGPVALEVVEVYAAEARERWRPAEIRALGACAFALHYSRRSAALAAELAERAGAGALFRRMTHVCLSARRRQAARGDRRRHVRIAATPDEPALFATLIEAEPVFPSHRRLSYIGRAESGTQERWSTRKATRSCPSRPEARRTNRDKRPNDTVIEGEAPACEDATSAGAGSRALCASARGRDRALGAAAARKPAAGAASARRSPPRPGGPARVRGARRRYRRGAIVAARRLRSPSCEAEASRKPTRTGSRLWSGDEPRQVGDRRPRQAGQSLEGASTAALAALDKRVGALETAAPRPAARRRATRPSRPVTATSRRFAPTSTPRAAKSPLSRRASRSWRPKALRPISPRSRTDRQDRERACGAQAGKTAKRQSGRRGDRRRGAPRQARLRRAVPDRAFGAGDARRRSGETRAPEGAGGRRADEPRARRLFRGRRAENSSPPSPPRRRGVADRAAPRPSPQPGPDPATRRDRGRRPAGARLADRSQTSSAETSAARLRPSRSCPRAGAAGGLGLGGRSRRASRTRSPPCRRSATPRWRGWPRAPSPEHIDGTASPRPGRRGRRSGMSETPCFAC